MRVSPIFTDTLRELRYGTRGIIHQGGQYSGKTVGILGALAAMAVEEQGGTTTVTSMSFPHLKGGALRDFEDYIYPTFKYAIKQYHKTDHTFIFHSGHKIEFKVFETEMAARGQKRRRLFINEANSFDWLRFFQLNSRSDQTIIDYNPTIQFWAHNELMGTDGWKLFISDHRHNPFLSAQKHAEIENIYQRLPILDEGGRILRYEEKGDFELWKVYARGATGNVMGVIFPNWEMIDYEDFPQNEDYVFGVDYGYTIDPTAVMRMILVGNVLYVDEIGYQTGMDVRDIIECCYQNGYKDHMPFYSEHDADMIKRLRMHSDMYVHPARKGQGSIKAGIDLLKSYKVKYTNRSRNLHRERGQYIWMVDKQTGKSVNIPIDKNNHTFDAIRYGAYSHYLQG
jgi:phage terminase large subunit